jgi:hypothetical protein
MDKFFAGMFAGIFVFAGALSMIPTSLVKQANEAVHECEKSLPRDQHCKIVALPVDKD